MFQKTTATDRVAALKKRIRAIQGGTSAGKTIATLQVICDLAMTDEVPTLTSVVSESFPHLKRGAMRDFLNIMQQHRYYREQQWNRTDSIYTFRNGSKIEFFGADASDKVRGPRRDRLFVNEANNVPFETFEQLEVRTSQAIFLDWNPTAAFWFDEELLPTRPNDIDHIILTYLDNEGLSPEIVQSIESRKERKNWWTVFGLGQLGQAEGKIYSDWKAIPEIPHEAVLWRRGLDFGYTNDPTTIVSVYRHNGGIILRQELYQTNMKNRQIADFVRNLEEPNLLVKADSSEPKSIDELREMGINVIGADKGPGSINRGIDKLQGLRVSVTSDSVDLLKEYRNYMWLTDRDGKVVNTPIDDWNHILDAARYALEDYSDSVPRMATFSGGDSVTRYGGVSSVPAPTGRGYRPKPSLRTF